jgi:hypothetical protein
MAKPPILALVHVDRTILTIRGDRVMLDRDLAEVYGVTTKALNQAVKRNEERFPADFRFQLTREERDEVVTNCDHLDRVTTQASVLTTRRITARLRRYTPRRISPLGLWRGFAFSGQGVAACPGLSSKPIGVAEYQHVRALPEPLDTNMPGIEEIEPKVSREDER